MGALLTTWMLSGLLAFAPQAVEPGEADPPEASAEVPAEAVPVPEALPENLEFAVFLEQFERYCVSGFPDDAAFHRRIGTAQSAYVPWGDNSDQQNRAWVNGPVRLQYLDRNIAAPVPTPQCFMSADIAPQGDHLTMARAIGAALGIGSGKSSGRGGQNRTIWTVEARANAETQDDAPDAETPLETAPESEDDMTPAEQVRTQRIIFLTQPQPDGLYRTRLIIMAVDQG